MKLGWSPTIPVAHQLYLQCGSSRINGERCAIQITVKRNVVSAYA